MQRALEMSLSSLDEGDTAAAAVSTATEPKPAVLAQLRVVAGRGGRCGHHALHNAILGATVASMPGTAGCSSAKSFLSDMLRDVAFWSRYHENVAMIKARCLPLKT